MIRALLICFALVSICHAAEEPAVTTDPVAAPATEDVAIGPAAPAPAQRCLGERLVRDSLLDRTHLDVYRGLCYSAVWLDGFFGDRPYGTASQDVAGRLGVSTLWDQRDGFKVRLRLRARLPLPAFENKLRLLIGLGDQRQLIEDRRPGGSESLPTAFRDVNDTAWLLGLGYTPSGELDHGFDFGVGVHLHIPPDPFVKSRYQYSLPFGERSVAHFQETGFWQNSRGLGETTQGDLDRLLGERFLLRWANSATLARDTDGLAWSTSLALYQSLRERRSMVYTVFIEGETQADVRLQNYGVQVRHRRSVLRDWLFVEMSGNITWPRVLITEERKTDFGVGLGVEMYFGHVAKSEMR